MSKMTSYILGLALITILILWGLRLVADNKKSRKIPNWALNLTLFILVFLALGEIANIIIYLVRS
jgi:hypothetical protein